MDDYNQLAHQTSKRLTQQYSSSFSRASSLYPKAIRSAIYDIYGLVRIADEIVDTYKGSDKVALLDALEIETTHALKSGYSSNVIVHAFIITALQCQIGVELIAPFFNSMRVDALGQKRFTTKEYDNYIFGSAEVVGLMCLKVFSHHTDCQYDTLKNGAQALGSAFQKINFLRDLASDYYDLGRYYFPIDSFESFNNDTRDRIADDITKDLTHAREAIVELPRSVRSPVAGAYNMYSVLFDRLRRTPSETIKQQRIRISDPKKIWWLVAARSGYVRNSAS